MWSSRGSSLPTLRARRPRPANTGPSPGSRTSTATRSKSSSRIPSHSGRLSFAGCRARSGNLEDLAVNVSDPWRETDGERSSPKSQHPVLSDPAVRAALALLVDRGTIQEQVYGRLGVATANYLNAPSRFRSPNTRWEFSAEKASQALDQAGWKRGADGIRAK